MTEPLLVARLLFRSRDAFSQLPHVVENVSACLDTSVDMSIGRAGEFESIRLLERIWGRSDVYVNMTETPTSDEDWDLGRYLRTDKHYRQYQFNEALKWAAGQGNVAMAKWLFEHFPGCEVRAKAVKYAAKFGFLDVLQYFFDNDSGRLPRRAQGIAKELGHRVEWSSDLMTKAAKRGHSNVVWWLNENLRNIPFARTNAFMYAVTNGDIALAEWLLHHGAVWPAQENCRTWIAHEIAAKGRLDVLKWMDKKEQLDGLVGVVVKAAEKGRLEMVQWLIDRDAQKDGDIHLTDLGGEASLAIHTAAVNGHVDVAKYLRARAKSPKDALQRAIQSKEQQERLSSSWRVCVWYRAGRITRDTMILAAENGFLDVVQWLCAEFSNDPEVDLFDSTKREARERVQHIHAMDAAASNGHLDVLKYLYGLQQATTGKRKRDHEAAQKAFPRCSTRALISAAQKGHFEVVQWLWSNVPEVRSDRVVDAAVRSGRFDMLQWLHEHGSRCTTAAMDDAARFGRFEMLKWLHANRSEGCTTSAMDGAAESGHLEIVQWLHNNTDVGCTTAAMDNAAGGGHLKTVKWLHANRSEGCTTSAMDNAAVQGYLHVAKWLHLNRTEGCTTEAMDWAADSGDIRRVQWLHRERSEAFRADELDSAAKSGKFELLLFLHSQVRMEWTESDNELAYSNELPMPDLHAWVLEHYPSLRAPAE